MAELPKQYLHKCDLDLKFRNEVFFSKKLYMYVCMFDFDIFTYPHTLRAKTTFYIFEKIPEISTLYLLKAMP